MLLMVVAVAVLIAIPFRMRSGYWPWEDR